MENQRILSEIAVQIIGFLVVFFVLKKVAWSKLLGAIEDRRKAIEQGFTDIERQKSDLQRLEKEYRDRIEHIEQEARTKIQEAANLGLTLAKDIQEKARADAQKTVDRAKAEIEHDLAQAKISIRNEIVEVSGLMAEKVLREKLDADHHRKLVDRFLKEIEKV